MACKVKIHTLITSEDFPQVLEIILQGDCYWHCQSPTNELNVMNSLFNISPWEGVLVLEDQYICISRENKQQ